MKMDYLQKISTVLSQAFHDLGLNVQPKQVQKIAYVINQAMTAPGRYYHTPEHALSLTNPDNPIQSIAALFHDLIYYQIDHGFSEGVWKAIKPYLTFTKKGEGSYRLATDVPGDDLSYHLVREIFGFPVGMELYIAGGSNEFLSTLAMAKYLENFLLGKFLLQVTAYIEATIPFRSEEKNGVDPFEQLEHSLHKVTREYAIPITGVDITNTVRGALTFANADVENFARNEPAEFLENTWKLLPENNTSLRRGREYTLKEYRLALQELAEFLHSIRPQDVFHEYQGIPSPDEMHARLKNTQMNLRVGSEYVEIKLMTVSILEALAEVSGGDAPISHFLGDVSRPGINEGDLASFLPQPEPSTETGDGDLVIRNLLASGRKGMVDYTDGKISPLALFIYQRSGKRKVRTYCDTMCSLLADSITPLEFLHSLDPSLVAIIAQACANTATSRKDRLLPFAQDIAQ